jgi:hypothetical protein
MHLWDLRRRGAVADRPIVRGPAKCRGPALVPRGYRGGRHIRAVARGLFGGEPTWLRKKAEGFKVSAFGKVWSELARVFFTSAAWVGAAMCPGRGHKRTFA